MVSELWACLGERYLMSSARFTLIIFKELQLLSVSCLGERFSLESLDANGEYFGYGCEHSIAFLRAKGAFF
jgi:hypothetical protein